MTAARESGAGFAPFQAAFVASFAAEAGPGSRHLLIAPVGSGKSFAVAGAVKELVRAARASRVLLLAPMAVLAHQWADLLGDAEKKPVIVDSRQLRMLQQEYGHSPGSWPDGIFVMSVDLAKREDARTLLAAVRWDLVVVDEAHALGGERMLLVEALTVTPRPPALLLASAMPVSDSLRSVARGAKVIDWCSTVAAYRAEQEVSGELLRVTRTYRRSDEEIAVARRVVDVARALGPLQGTVLLRRACSSLAGLEETTARILEPSSEQLPHREDLEALLEAIEELQSDTKLRCFVELAGELVTAGVRHIVAMSEYRDTVDYLAAATESLACPVFVLHGGLTDEARHEVVHRFRTDGGLLITTAAATGCALSYVDAVIHFDLPFSAEGVAQREGRYHRIGRTTPCTVYILLDESGALPVDAIQLRLIQKLDHIGMELGPDLASLLEEVVLK